MSNLSELKKSAKKLKHPATLPLHAWKVSKVKGSPTNQYRLSYGEHHTDFYYFKNTPYSMGPLTVLSIAGYKLLTDAQYSVERKPLLDLAFDTTKSLMDKYAK